MNFARNRRLPIAWMLFAFILFNGLVCSIGHGQMLGAFSAPVGTPSAASLTALPEPMEMPVLAAAERSGMHMDGDSDPTKMDMSGAMQSMFGGCSFAGTVTLAMVFFIALGWLLRTRQPRLRLPLMCLGEPLRHAIFELNPQAP